jgi:hypothetical protein
MRGLEWLIQKHVCYDLTDNNEEDFYYKYNYYEHNKILQIVFSSLGTLHLQKQKP